MDLGLFTLTTNLLPAMPACFIMKLRDIVAGDDHSSIGGLDGMQSIPTAEITRICASELTYDFLGVIAALSGAYFYSHDFLLDLKMVTEAKRASTLANTDFK